MFKEYGRRQRNRKELSKEKGKKYREIFDANKLFVSNNSVLLYLRDVHLVVFFVIFDKNEKRKTPCFSK